MSFQLFKKAQADQLLINKLYDDVIMPTKAHTGIFSDAAFDLYFYEPKTNENTECIPEITLRSGERICIGTGIRMVIPDGYWVKLQERSGLANKGLHILGGVIDSAYTGEVRVIAYNSGIDPIVIPCDKAIAQFTIEKCMAFNLVAISHEDLLYHESLRSRKDKGFGSSDGKK